MRQNPNYDVVKEPRGFIKCLEIFLAIFAFACATGYRGHPKIVQTANIQNITKYHNAEATIQYPFDQGITMNVMYLNNGTVDTVDISSELDERSKMEFFVVIGVFCFLYSLGMLVYYIFFEEDSATNATPITSSMFSLPTIDLGFGAFWTLFWFFSACAFAAGVNNLKDSASTETLIGGSFKEFCKKGIIDCEGHDAKYATLTVAILLGFLNVFVWAGNIWFLWKETSWHNNSGLSANSGPSTVQQQSQPPAAAI